MNEFYVYTRKDQDPDERHCIYVDKRKLQQFADKEYDPKNMEYSGVIVEALTPQHAHVVYNTFGDSGKIIWADEPEETVAKHVNTEVKDHLYEIKEMLSHAEQAAASLALRAYAQNLSLKIMEVNDKISKMAKIARRASKSNPEVDVHAIYKKLKWSYIQSLLKQPFIDEDGKTD